jgi:diguanylate cyclase (GGDEF)-like protein
MTARRRASQAHVREGVSRALARLFRRRAALDAFFEGAPVGLALLDDEGRFLRVNAELARLVGVELSTLPGRQLAEAAPQLAAPAGFSQDDRDWLVRHFSVVEPAGCVGIVVTEVTELKRIEQQLEELLCLEQSRSVEIEAKNDMLASLAATDPLTGLANRRSFAEALGRAVSRAERDGGELAILYLDLDHFKPVNDVHGHDAGDALLVETARRLREAARDSDVVARLGGDEFLLLLGGLEAGTGESIAGLVSQRLVESIRQPVELDSGAASVSVSVGVALFPADAKDAAGLLASADAAMYLRKRCRSARPAA